ncbi:unnamed protein product [Protopolystoma xenopodis]|uniref:Uncharacterized protein n=1 Tax=Protopolystoma xenopodis TaxID=117903 RepID=A0A3S5CU40_9PLAT|nr:unnamed protein product [Protopolystoma xenopodis]
MVGAQTAVTDGEGALNPLGSFSHLSHTNTSTHTFSTNTHNYLARSDFCIALANPRLDANSSPVESCWPEPPTCSKLVRSWTNQSP